MAQKTTNHFTWVYALIALVGAVVLAVLGYMFYRTHKTSPSNIHSFAECTAAGYPVQESYPEVCSVPGVQSFSNPDQKVELSSANSY